MSNDPEAGASSDVRKFIPIEVAEGKIEGTAQLSSPSDVHLTFVSACVWVPAGQWACIYIDGEAGLIPIVLHRQGNFGIYDRFAGAQAMDITVSRLSEITLSRSDSARVARAQIQVVGRLIATTSPRTVDSDTRTGEARSPSESPRA